MPGDRKIIPFTSSRPLTLAQQFRRAAKGLEAARLTNLEAERVRGEAELAPWQDRDPVSN